MSRAKRTRPAPILDWVEGEPPPAQNGERHFAKPVGYKSPTLRALKAWPGRWAIVYRSFVRSSATSRATFLKRLGCEATTRKFSPASATGLYVSPLITTERKPVYLVYAQWPA